MKNLTFLLAGMLTAFTLSAQNYECIIPTDTVLFNLNNSLHPISVTHVTQGTDYDTLHLPHDLRNDPVDDHTYVKDMGGWMGNYVLKNSNGEYIFNNFLNESILIKNNASLNESWECFNNGSSIIQATLINKEEQTFLDITDTVQEITFQLVSTTRDEVLQNLTDVNLKISRQYGLIETPSMFLFPYTNTHNFKEVPGNYTLTGHTQNNTKVNLTAFDIYNFSIGDEFHCLYLDKPLTGYNTIEQTIYKILDKTYDTQENTFHYQMLVCKKRTTGEVTTLQQQDTIMRTYNCTPSLMDQLPDQLLQLENFSETNYTTMQHNEYGQLIKNNYYGFQEINGMIELVIFNKSTMLSDPGINEGTYIEGAGGPYYIIWSTAGTISYDLVYCKSGKTEWGNPYNCTQLVSTPEISLPSLNIFPNPVQNQLTLSGLNKTAQRIDITTPQGGIVIQHNHPASTTQINTANLCHGIYLVRIYTSDGVITRKIVK